MVESIRRNDAGSLQLSG